MRLITVDNGNTNPHVGIHENGQLSVVPLKNYVAAKDDFILISDVGAPLSFQASFDLKSKRHTKDNPYFFDMPVHYAETLGDDRLIAGYMAFKNIKNPDEKVLVIDAGTFITMDVVTKKGFMGGYIFPGHTTFLMSYSRGARLPNLMPENEILLKQLPSTTEEAILGAADLYLDAILENTIKKASPNKILLTGGSFELIRYKIEKLNLKVQLESVPHLIHSALALIYQTHLQSK